MRTRTRILLSALTAALVLASAISTASARRIELSNQRIRVTWTGANSLTFESGIANAEVICEVTIEGSFHSRTLSKVSGQLVGYITSAMIKRPCIKNNAWVLNGTESQPGEAIQTTLPWHILFVSWEGVLPRIRKIRLSLINAGFLVVNIELGIHCLYKSTATQPMLGDITVNETTGQATTLSPDPTVAIPWVPALSNPFCPTQGTLAGTGAIRLQGSATTLIFVRLVQ
jgi:hypothetical protein